MILVDSSVWADYFDGRASPETDLLDGLLGRQLVVTGNIILTEVLRGFQSDRSFHRARSLLELVECREMMSKTVAIRTAENYRRLRKRGVTLNKTIGIMIGTFCILEGLPLLHADPEFDPMEQHLGLPVYRP